MNKNLNKFYEEESKVFLERLGIPYPYIIPQSLIIGGNQYKKLVFADPHEPYTKDEIFEEAYLIHADADTCLIEGDLGDFYSKSRFRKTHSVNFREELRAIFYRLEWLSVHFQEVLIMEGNHDNRPQKKIADLFGDGDIDLNILTENNLLKRLASYFENIKIVGTQIQNHEHNILLTHIFQYGDIIFTHGEVSRKQDSAIGDFLSIYLHRWGDKLGLKPFRVIVQAHNHRGSKTIKGGELWMLIPCSMEDISIGGEYIYSPRMVGDPPVRGYAVFYQDKGVTDWNKSNFYVYK
jgi:metallophosphoesterase superfamily enzyme